MSPKGKVRTIDVSSIGKGGGGHHSQRHANSVNPNARLRAKLPAFTVNDEIGEQSIADGPNDDLTRRSKPLKHLKEKANFSRKHYQHAAVGTIEPGRLTPNRK